MAADEIQITLSADDAKAVRAWQRQRDNIEAFEKGLDGVGKKQKKVADDADEFGMKALGSLGKMATTVIGIGTTLQAFSTAASLVAAEINNAVDRQKDAAQASLSLPDAKRQLYANIGRKSQDLGKTTEERNAAANQMAERLSQETGVGFKDAIVALSDAFSLREGNDSSQTVFEAARASLLANPDDQKTARALTAGVLGIRRGRANISAEQSIGYMQEAGAVLPIKETADSSRLLARALAAVEAAGGDERFSAGFAGAAATAAKDDTGDRTATFVVNAMNKLKKAAPDKATPMEQIDAIIPIGAQFAKDRVEFDKLELSATRTDAETKRLNQLKTKHAAFLSLTETGEAQFNPFIRDLLSGGAAYQQLKDNMKDVPSFAESGPLYEENVRAANADPALRIARLKRLMESGAQREQFSDVGGAAQSITREGLTAIAKAAGDTAIEQQINAAIMNIGALGAPSEKQVVGSTAKAMERRISALRNPTTEESVSFGEMGGTITVPRAASAAELEQANRLQKTLDGLQLLLKDISENGIKAKVKNVADERQPNKPRAADQQSGGGV